MLLEHGIDSSLLFLIPPIVAITKYQAQAIFRRDNFQCKFPFGHICKGKITVHHISDKSDDPNNILTVCHDAHWGYLHNGASAETKEEWETALLEIARQNTQKAKERGWEFPME